MDPIFVIMIILGSFLLGFFVQQKLCALSNRDQKCKAALKKHRDIKNWLKSELKMAQNNKLTKNIDKNKVRLLDIIIRKLEQ